MIGRGEKKAREMLFLSVKRLAAIIAVKRKADYWLVLFTLIFPFGNATDSVFFSANLKTPH